MSTVSKGEEAQAMEEAQAKAAAPTCQRPSKYFLSGQEEQKIEKKKKKRTSS